MMAIIKRYRRLSRDAVFFLSKLTATLIRRHRQASGGVHGVEKSDYIKLLETYSNCEIRSANSGQWVLAIQAIFHNKRGIWCSTFEFAIATIISN